MGRVHDMKGNDVFSRSFSKHFRTENCATEIELKEKIETPPLLALRFGNLEMWMIGRLVIVLSSQKMDLQLAYI